MKHNQLMAEFMGDEYSLAVSKVNENNGHYHLSFDWIIPVWYKFRDLQINDHQHWFFCEHVKEALCNKTLDDVYNVLGDALMWYKGLPQQITP
jgi:hypothetical protein